MSLNSLIQLAQILGIPRSKLDVFLTLAQKRPIKSIVDLKKILVAMKLDQDTSNAVMSRYIGTIRAPSISSGSSLGNVKNNAVSAKTIKAATSSGSKRKLSVKAASSSTSKRQRSGPPAPRPVASGGAPKKRGPGRPKSSMPRFTSLKQALEHGNISRSEFLRLVNAHHNQNVAAKVRKTLNGVPPSFDKAILPHITLNTFHSVKAKRLKLSSTGELIDAAVKGTRTARLLAQELSVPLPKTIKPVDRQLLHNAAARAVLGLAPRQSSPAKSSSPPKSSPPKSSPQPKKKQPKKWVDEIAQKKLKELLKLEILEEEYRLKATQAQKLRKTNPFARINNFDAKFKQLDEDKIVKFEELQKLRGQKTKFQDKSLIQRIDTTMERILRKEQDRMRQLEKNSLARKDMRNMIKKIAGEEAEEEEREGSKNSENISREGIMSKNSENISREALRRAKSLPLFAVPHRYSYTRLFSKPGSMQERTNSIMTNAAGGRSTSTSPSKSSSGNSQRTRTRTTTGGRSPSALTFSRRTTSGQSSKSNPSGGVLFGASRMRNWSNNNANSSVRPATKPKQKKRIVPQKIG